MIGTILSITDDILFNPPAIVKKHVIPNTITASKGLIPNASFREFTTDSVCTQHVHGPRTKQQIASKKAPFFHPSAFFITNDLSHIYSSIEFLYFTRYLCPRMISQAFVDIPRSAEIHIQKIAPGPPIVIAVATPPMFPTPIVLAIAVHAAANPDTVPSPYPFPLNIFPNVFWK